MIKLRHLKMMTTTISERKRPGTKVKILKIADNNYIVKGSPNNAEK